MLPGSPGIHRLHYKLSTKNTTQLEIKWTKPGLSIPLHHPQQQHLLNCTSDSFNQYSGDHSTKKASSEDICNSVDAGPETISICPALNVPKQHEVWLSCHWPLQTCRENMLKLSISSFNDLPVSMVMRRRILYILTHIRSMGPSNS